MGCGITLLLCCSYAFGMSLSLEGHPLDEFSTAHDGPAVGYYDPHPDRSHLKPFTALRCSAFALHLCGLSIPLRSALTPLKPTGSTGTKRAVTHPEPSATAARIR